MCRQAIEVNRRDYRAWYGLGQTYEILKMHHYCLYYFKQVNITQLNCHCVCFYTILLYLCIKYGTKDYQRCCAGSGAAPL